MPSDARHSGGLSGSALDEVTSRAAGAAVTNQRERGAGVEAGKVCHEETGSRLEERLCALEAERRRIEGFMEMLPHCRDLLDKEIESMREKIEVKRLLKVHGKSSLLENHMDSSRRQPIEPEESVVPSNGGAVWDDSSTSGDAGIGVNPVHLSPAQGERDCPELFKKRRTEQPMHDETQAETERCKARFPLSNCMEKPLGMLTLACDSQLVDGNDKFDNLQASEKHDRRHGCRLEGKAAAEDGDNAKPSWLWRGVPREQHLVEQNASKEHNEKGHAEGYHHGVRQSWLHEPVEQKDELGSGRCQHLQPHLALTSIKGGNENHSMQTAGNDISFLQPGRERPGGAFLPFVPNRDNKASTGVGTEKGASTIQSASLPVPACIELVLGLAPGTVPEPRHRGMQMETFKGTDHGEHADMEMMQVDRTHRLLTAESAPNEDRLETPMTVAGNIQKKEEDMVVRDPSREGSKGRTVNGEGGGDANGNEGAESGGSESSDNSGGRESDATNTALQASPDAMRTAPGTMLTTSFNGSSGGGHRKARRCWSPELHRRFVDALTILGGPQVATPKQIRELMKVEGLTNDEVKSHLQKYRLHTRRPSPPQNISLPHPPQVFVLGSFYLPDYGSSPTLAQQPPIVATTPAGVYDTAAVAAAAAAAAAAAGAGTAAGGFGTPVASLAAAGVSQQRSHFGLHASSLQTQAGLSTQPSPMLHQHQFFPCKPAHGLTATAIGQVSLCRPSQRESPQHPSSQPEIEVESTPLSMGVGLGATRQAREQEPTAEQHLRPSCEDRTVELSGAERKYVRDVNGEHLGAGAHAAPADGVDVRRVGSLEGGSRKRSLETANARGREGEASPMLLKLQLNEDHMNSAGYSNDCHQLGPRAARAMSGIGGHRSLYCTQPVLSQSG
ncbi:hypothetical protein CBR_g3557 [Chara braunii]|uniref:HTH myb-type domain-containing protein n=1 Tax=Chara braunii TaxID=69332 RepID=A0A388KFM7_CHABU|nr:hypothetical protein CBR_g3557 [Chara braunii]|eukprot:GBG68864.1 hypothetical protein CBR_g3557 [Chara braunii]